MVDVVINGQRDLDETQRKLDLATLRIERLELESRSELRFRALLERSAEAVALSSADGIVHHGVLESGVALLHKPITSDTLLRKVREVLDGVASDSPP